MRQHQPGPQQHRLGAASPADLPGDQSADLPTVQIRSGFLAGLRRRPVWTLTVRAADGVLLARERTASYVEAVAIARATWRAPASAPRAADCSAPRATTR